MGGCNTWQEVGVPQMSNNQPQNPEGTTVPFYILSKYTLSEFAVYCICVYTCVCVWYVFMFCSPNGPKLSR